MFDWHDYLKLAESLRDVGDSLPSEAAKRSAISRAYYACFGHICQFERRERNFDHGKLDVHSALITHLSQRRKQNIARGLRELRNWRNDADYKQELANVDELCVQAVERANTLIKQKL